MALIATTWVGRREASRSGVGFIDLKLRLNQAQNSVAPSDPQHRNGHGQASALRSLPVLRYAFEAISAPHPSDYSVYSLKPVKQRFTLARKGIRQTTDIAETPRIYAAIPCGEPSHDK